jgi:exodeoxyribonuclease V gamma subunit
VPNPCRYHWADIIDGRELLRATRRRHALRGETDPAALPLEALHAHANPLLANWGRLGRDFIRLLDLFDDAAATQERFDIGRIDLFDDAAGQSLLQQLQARIRELEQNVPKVQGLYEAARRNG